MSGAASTDPDNDALTYPGASAMDRRQPAST